MKTLIATAALALSVSAPAFADVDAKAFFAMGNDSAAETLVRETSVGDVTAAEVKFAMTNMSAAEETVFSGQDSVTRGDVLDAKRFFSQFNNSAAEIK